MAQSTSAIRTVRKDTSFNWEGMDRKGQRIKGRAVAQNEQSLKADLRRQGVVATRIKKQSQAFKGGGRVKAEDIAIFSRQLATNSHVAADRTQPLPPCSPTRRGSERNVPESEQPVQNDGIEFLN